MGKMKVLLFLGITIMIAVASKCEPGNCLAEEKSNYTVFYTTIGISFE